MIMDERFLEWYEKADGHMKASVINFIIYVSASLSLWNRIKVAFEILMGKRYCLWVSRNQSKYIKS